MLEDYEELDRTAKLLVVLIPHNEQRIPNYEYRITDYGLQRTLG